MGGEPVRVCRTLLLTIKNKSVILFWVIELIKYSVFSDSEWLYPDSNITAQTSAELHSAKNGDVCFQILTDYQLSDGEKIDFEFEISGCTAEVMQLLPVCVTANSSASYGITKNYDEVKDFVTKKAPFWVYDVTKPIFDGETVKGRAAFFVRINVSSAALAGNFDTKLKLCIGKSILNIPICLKIYSVTIPDIDNAAFHMTNWLQFEHIEEKHSVASLYGVKEYSEESYKIIKEYMRNLVDMRNDTLMLPLGKPVKDKNGNIVSFDFSDVERVGNLARECGFKYIMGGFVARWSHWQDTEVWLCWDRSTNATSMEGYRQLKLYFEGIKKLIKDNGWAGCYWQCLVDEPQDFSAKQYRALSAICRKLLPGVIINDPVETVDVQGALDIWVVKQAIYDKKIEEFRALQEMGENMWIYTCGYPAGKVMNRVIDLPLLASRLLMWMCYGYNANGFLHFGYCLHNKNAFEDVNFHVDEQITFPAGNGHAVYAGPSGPWYSVRGHAQRTGAQDFELLNILGAHGKTEKAKELVCKLCRNFSDYETDAAVFAKVRKELLEILE